MDMDTARRIAALEENMSLALGRLNAIHTLLAVIACELASRNGSMLAFLLTTYCASFRRQTLEVLSGSFGFDRPNDCGLLSRCGRNE